MSSTLTPIGPQGNRFTEEERQRGYVAVAIAGGNCEEAARLLAQDEDSPDITASTLKRWVRVTNVAEYEQVRERIMPRIQARVAAASEDIAIRAVEKEAELLEALDVKRLEPRDVGTALRSVSVTAGIATDRTLKLRGQPTQIIEHRDASEILDKMKQRIGPAEAEIVDAEEVTVVPAVGRE